MRRCGFLLIIAGLLDFTGSTLAGTLTCNCLPIEILEADNRFHVLCAEPKSQEGGYPLDGSDRIQFFAVPKSDTEFARRFVHITQTALISGLVVQFLYTNGDKSGEAFGCVATNCRKPFAFSLLATSVSQIPYTAWPDSCSFIPIAKYAWAHYGPFAISKYRKFIVLMKGTGNANLYIHKDHPPTDGDSIYFYGHGASWVGRCTTMVAQGEMGRYYVGVKGGNSIFNTFQLTIRMPSTLQ